MTSENSEDDFKVGYKRPPQHSRFQPGSSGNPGGKQKAVLLRLREMALKGDARSLDRLLALAQIFNNGAAIESLGDKTVAAEDQAILDAYAAEVLSRALSATALRLGATDDNGSNADG